MHVTHTPSLIFLMCISLALGLASFMAFPALLPFFIDEWHLTNAQAGWIAGISYGSYMIAVLVLSSLTDTIDARLVFLVSVIVAVVSVVGFAWGATGVVSASFWRLIQGVAVAGIYMPGLRILTDRVGANSRSRAVAFYTAHFVVGAASSTFAAGLLMDVFDWQISFTLLGLGPILAGLIVLVATKPQAQKKRLTQNPTALFQFGVILRHRAAMGYSLVYGRHGWEMFAFRSWLTVLLGVILARGGMVWEDITGFATLVLIFGLPGSVLGNELAEIIGRRKTAFIAVVMPAVMGIILSINLSSDMSVTPGPWIVVIFLAYGFFTMSKSAVVTAGLVEVAPPEQLGSAMALHSLMGFGGAFIGPVVFGAVLDFSGGINLLAAWHWALGSLVLVLSLAPFILWWSRDEKEGVS